MNPLGSMAALRLLRENRNFRLYIAGMAATGVGVWIQTIAIAWLTWESTRSTTWLGGIALAEALPALILALVSGAIVDRFDYFKIMRITQAFQFAHAATIAVLSLAGLMNIWLLLGLTIVRGAVLAFARPSRMTLLFALVGRDALPPALGTQSIIFNTARFAGPALGGLIIATAGISWAFVAAAAMFLMFTVILAVVDAPPRAISAATSLASATADGIRYVLVHPGIRPALLLLVAVSLFARPLTEMLPGLADRVLGLGADGLALLFTVHGFGAMLGATCFAAWRRGVSGMTGIAIVSTLIAALALAFVAITSTLAIACLALGLAGFGFLVHTAAIQTLIQSSVDPHMRGRVLSMFGVIAEGLPSVGAIAIGALAEHYGLRAPLLGGALLCFCAWLWAWQQRERLKSNLEPTGEA